MYLIGLLVSHLVVFRTPTTFPVYFIHMDQLWELAVNPQFCCLVMALVHQLPLQLYWIFPSQTGCAVTHSLAGLVTGADHLVLVLEGGDSLLDS